MGNEDYVQEQFMICPACQHPMIGVEYQKVELDFCTNCRGVWFDKGELELLLECTGEAAEIGYLDSILKSVVVAVTEEKSRRCPICQRRMKKQNIGEKDKVLLDICSVGDGIWFDSGEVDQLVKILNARESVKHDHVFNFIKAVFKTPA
jgi:Zn-finger nucleic acid-binding protein